MAEPNREVPAVVEEPAQPLQQGDDEPVNNIVVANPRPRDEEAHRELPGNMYRLKAPVFTGNEDVEQFIQEFSDVAEVTQWPPAWPC